MSTVRVYDSQGRPWDVPAERMKDAPAGLPAAPPMAMGTTPQGLPGPVRAGFAPGTSYVESPAPMRALLGPLGDRVIQNAALAAPTMLGAAGDLLGKESWIAGPGLAALGGGLGEGIHQGTLAAYGHPQADPWGAIRTQAGAQGAAALTGRLVAGGAGRMGEGMMQEAMRVSPTVTKQAQKVARRALGPTAERVSPEAAAAGRQAIRERTPVGERPFIGGKAGSNQVQAKINEALQRASIARDAAESAGHTNTIYDVNGSDAIRNLRREIEAPGNPDAIKQSKWLDQKLEQLVTRNAGPRVGGKMGKLRRITPNQLAEMIDGWQAAAKPVYDASGKPLSVQPLSVRLNAALARAGTELERKIPDFGDAIHDANQRVSSLIPLATATSNAEMRRVTTGGFRPLGSPWFPLAAGGAAGYATHNPGEGAAAAIATMLLQHGMRDPAILSRLALGLTSPAVKYGAPLAAHTLAGFGVPPQDVPAPPGRQPGPNAQGR